MFAVALRQPVRAVGVRRRKRRRPRGVLEEDNKGKRPRAAGIWRNEAKFLNDYLVVQNEPPAVIANGKNSVISSPTIMTRKKRRSSEFTLDSRSAAIYPGRSQFRTWPRPREPRPKTDSRAWNDPALDKEFWRMDCIEHVTDGLCD